jgi:hypothetical protein
MPFLEDLSARPLNIAESRNMKPIALFLGNGPNALEVAVLESAATPTLTNLRAIWANRLGGRATPLLIVALHANSAALCGPNGDPPPAFPALPRGQVERLCRTALAEPDRNAALRFLNTAIPQVDEPLPGVRNEGLFALHELRYGLPGRLAEWDMARQTSEPLLKLRGEKLISALGYTIEPTPGSVSILRAGDHRRAVAVFLHKDESPDLPSPRFSDLSPVSYALRRADQESLNWVVVSAGASVRLHPVGTNVGVGRRGRAETYVELHLDLLAPEDAAYLGLIFSVSALEKGGAVDRLLQDSARYATDLGTRLRERIYSDVVPDLAMAILAARGLKNAGPEELNETYQMTLVYLFRILFVSYAEDKELLPYKQNSLYRDRSLKHKAQELVNLRLGGAHFGSGTALWEEIDGLFKAVDKGNPSWGVPPYNGGLFSRDANASSIGARLANISVPDSVLGPILTNLLADQSNEGWGPVDFRSLGVREFGTIYEGLLENELAIAEHDLAVKRKEKQEQYVPAKPKDTVVVAKGRAYLHNTSGSRKATGSYFTKHFAVEHLLGHALEPALHEHLQRLDKLEDEEAAAAFFDFRVGDLAMGSGHFLVSAIDRIERRLTNYLADRRLAAVHSELSRLREAANRALGALADSVSIESSELLRRQIARRCIYGLDLNPIAVDLARLAIWIHTFVPGLPLSFLDHNLRTGNALVGIGTLEEANS